MKLINYLNLIFKFELWFVRFMFHYLYYSFGDWRFVFSKVGVLWDANFRCFWATLSCLATSVFVEKNLKTQQLKTYNF